MTLEQEKFWYWIIERHNIFLKRKNGDKKPWTQDPIMQKVYFTNVFRELDKVTQHMRKFLPTRPMTAELLFNYIWYRIFNWPETAEAFGVIKEFEEEKMVEIVKKRKALGQRVFTAAYMLTCSSHTCHDKGEYYIRGTLTQAWKLRNELFNDIKKYNSIKMTTKILQKLYNIGDFIAYEIATDLRHTELLENAEDIYTWANPGVGARRGLNRYYGRPVKMNIMEQQCVNEIWHLFSISA